MNAKIIKLTQNRVRRNYQGGKTLKALNGEQNPIDDNMPEEWIASLVMALNPGMDLIEKEGLSSVKTGDFEGYLLDLISQDPVYYLGKTHYDKNGIDFGFLTKIIDSSMRLHTQAHPSREFAKRYLNSQYGKFECYYVLSTRENSPSYIRLGFQKNISKEKWIEIVANQQIDEMDDLFDEIKVSSGDMIYIPGGMPHAIGEGLFLIEVMEPSDLVVRCEFEREGIIVPKQARFMGKSIEFCMDIFDYTKYSAKEIKEKFFVKPQELSSEVNYKKELLLSSEISKSFEIIRLSIYKETELSVDNRFSLLIVTEGKATIIADDEKIELSYCESAFLPSATTKLLIKPNGDEQCVICQIQPPR